MLINKSDIQRYRQLNGKKDDATINSFIRDAEFMDLQPLLGVELYEDIVRNPSSHTDLLDGSTYTYNGITYTNVGLKIVLSHYAFARYIMFGGFIDTAYNYVQKQGNNSTPVDSKAKAIIYKSNQQIAFNYFDNVRKYLDRENYDNWNDCPMNNRNFRIRSL